MSTLLKMRHQGKFGYWLLVGIIVLAASQLSSAHMRDCSSLIAGRTYANDFSGFLNIGQLVPNAGGQYLRFHGNGTVTGLVTFSVGFQDPNFIQLTDLAVTGTYHVAWNPATTPPVCSGSVSVDSGPIHHDFQLVVNREGSSIEFLDTPNPEVEGFVLLGFTARPMHEGRCNKATLDSTYTYNAKGWITPPPPLVDAGLPLPGLQGLIPIAFSGAISFNGAGHLTGWDTVILDGVVAPRTYAGEYTVGPNCVVTSHFTDTLGNFAATENFVLEGGKGMIVININTDNTGTVNPGTVLSFIARRVTDGHKDDDGRH